MIRSSLWSLLAPAMGRLRVAVALQVVAALAGVVPFLAVAELGRVLLAGGPVDRGRVWAVAWVAAGALVVRAALYLTAGALTHFGDVDFQYATRRRMVARLGRVPLGWFTEHTSGLVKKAVTDDIGAMHHLVAHALLDLAAGIVVPLVCLAYLFTVDWRMTLVTLVPLVVGLYFYARAMSGAKTKVVEWDRALGRVSHAAVEFVEGIAVVKVFGQTRRAHRRFVDATTEYVSFFLSWVMAGLRASTLSEVAFSPVVTLVVVLGGGAVFVTRGWLPAVNLLPFALVGLALTAPVFALGQNAFKLRTARQAAAGVREVVDAAPLPEPAAPAIPAGHEVVFRDVRFSYDGRVDAVQGIDLTLRPGTVTALVGLSGSGKSTLAKLLPRFWDVTGGQITVGGVDVRQIPAGQLYRTVSFVFQDVQLVRTTIRDNIRLAAPEADEQTVRAAARAAQVDDRIMALPRGYDSVVGVDARLSGGEAQRVSIARALLADAPVLVLDEATAYADPASEAAIQDALARLAAGRTVLVIAHRLSTVVDADEIVVLDQGRIVQRGRHADLAAVEGRYRDLWEAQQRAAQWRPTLEGASS
jgi:ATP-binding cassette, subfamily B, bacterial IrtA/YbtP